jgi:hypothetical protein
MRKWLLRPNRLGTKASWQSILGRQMCMRIFLGKWAQMASSTDNIPSHLLTSIHN